MSRISLVALIVLAAALSGCSMCCNPFDYCAPIAGPDGRPNCDFGARRNSAFHPMDDAAESYAGADSEPAEQALPTPLPAYDEGGPQELPLPGNSPDEASDAVMR